MRAKLLKIKGNQAIVEFEVLPRLDELQVADDGYLHLDAYFDDIRYITNEQRKHYFALIGDIAYYTGDPLSEWDAVIRYKFMDEQQLNEYPSLANEAMSRLTASELLEFVITFCLDNAIPFRKQQWYLTTDINRILYKLTLKRICWISGERGDIHHATKLVGMGKKRKLHQHELSTFMCLSRKYHDEVHQIGLDAFNKKYHVKPINLSSHDLKKLGVI